MMNRKLVLTSFILLFVTCIKANEIILTGYIKNYSNDYFVMGTPIGDNFNRFNYKPSDTVSVNGGKFYTKISCQKPVFIYLNFFKNFIYLPVVPGDSIHIEFDIENQDHYRYIPCQFSGSNSEGHNRFYRYDFFPGNKFNDLRKILTGNATSVNMTTSILEEIKRQTAPFDSLLIRKNISSLYYKIVTKTIQSLLVGETLRKLNNQSVKSIIVPDSVRLKVSESLIQATMMEDSIISQCMLGDITRGTLLSFFQMKKAGSNDMYNFIHDSTIKYKGRDFFFKDYLFRYYGVKNEEYFLGNKILSFHSVGESKDTMRDAVEYYYLKYPNSEYSIAIRKILGSSKEEQSKNNAGQSTGKLKSFGNNIFYLNNAGALHNLKVNEFPQLKNGIVYVDIWATWCRPCLAEMELNYQVDSLLAMIGGKRLYISIDEQSAAPKWNEIIEKKGLGGYHVLAGEKLRKYLDAEFGFAGGAITIPYYIVLKDGQIVYKNAYRPSEFEMLKKQLVDLSK
ncbi:hypothetical protein OCK74_22710 [Chitinophagaceae bacterium LB-8]|uniref:Thioredoxin domain-containing protein n=1 Tax=Paraflavisolibacter caeni TaxID=2982496 RepID=A0A9X3BH56_9BACT|nr:hypothetical protein [Paraflavisolibacter caeni]MCU7551949.1 hypothetical protein [Paraflavisolibacter caeni]